MSRTALRPRCFHNTTNAAALPSDARGGDDDGCRADAEDFAQGAGRRCCEELGHGQSALGSVQGERLGEGGERGGVWAVREEGEDRGTRHAR